MSSGHQAKLKDRGPAVTFIVGLAGSGKSTLLNSLVYDVVFEECFWLNDDALERNHKELLTFLGQNKHCVITERRFMHREARDVYTRQLREDVPLLQINWFFFEKNLEAANHNCRSRTNKEGDLHGVRHIEQNEGDFDNYTIPDGAVAIKIHRWPGLAPSEAANYLQSMGPEPSEPETEHSLSKN
ncbi:MAG TPA: hypothetical protein VMX35_10750 [Acidobacteriota bacterium]|nr:hypothetical protein [Acidobacteriota bacterium]